MVDPELIASLSKLWPHREHESSAVKNMFCHIGLHRSRQLDLSELHPNRDVHFCFWCPKIKVDGVIHQP